MSTRRLDTLAQVGFLIMSLAVTVAAVHYVITARAAARPRSPAAITVGTKLTLPATATNEGRNHVLLAVLSSECRFCTESMPLYRRLVAARPVAEGRVRFRVVSVQPVAVMQAYLASHGLPSQGILTAEETGAYVRGTPSLILTDGGGVVRASWSGALPATEERDVLAALEKLR